MKNKMIHAFMECAHTFAKLSYCQRNKVGCVIVKDDTIIGIGYNGTPSGEDNVCEDENNVTKPDVIHAEDNAIRKLARTHNSAVDSTIFVTVAPCKVCAALLVDTKVREVVYDRIYRTTDGLEYLKKHNVIIRRIKEINS